MLKLCCLFCLTFIIKFFWPSTNFFNVDNNLRPCFFSFLDKLYQTEGTGNEEKVTTASYYQFVVLCFVLRSVMAVGTAFNETAAVSIMTISFKHAISTAQVSKFPR